MPRPAGEDDIGWVTGLLALTYRNSPVLRWALPSDDIRDALAGYLVRPIVEYALVRGHVDVVDGLAAAVWTPSGQPLPPAHPQEWETMWGEGTLANLPLLHDILTTRRPPGRDYLALLAVAGTARGGGIGTALLAHHHAYLDQHAVTGYVEATGDTTGFYRHAGYAADGDPIRLPCGGPVLHPMARTPSAVSPSAATGAKCVR